MGQCMSVSPQVKTHKMNLSEINKFDEDGWTALHKACREHNHKAVDKLLSKSGIDVNVRGKFGWTPLHAADIHNNPQAVKKLLARSDIEVNATHGMGSTPIMHAAMNCREEILKLLLADPRVNLDTGKNRSSLEELVIRSWGKNEEKKQKCLQMIKEEKLKRKNRQAGQRTSQDGQTAGYAGKTDTVEANFDKVEKDFKKLGLPPVSGGTSPVTSTSPRLDKKPEQKPVQAQQQKPTHAQQPSAPTTSSSQVSAPSSSADLLGLTTTPQPLVSSTASTTNDLLGLDTFDTFVSAPAVSDASPAPPASTAHAQPAKSPHAQPTGDLDEINFFNQEAPAAPAAVDSGKMTNDSILTLFGSSGANKFPSQPQLAGFPNMAQNNPFLGGPPTQQQGEFQAQGGFAQQQMVGQMGGLNLGNPASFNLGNPAGLNLGTGAPAVQGTPGLSKSLWQSNMKEGI